MCQPGGGKADHRHDPDRHDGRARREELPYPGVAGKEAQAGDQEARHQGDQRGPRMREEKDGHGDCRSTGGEPKHDHHPGRERRILSDLRGEHGPDHAGEPVIIRKGMTWGYQGAKEHRAERH